MDGRKQIRNMIQKSQQSPNSMLENFSVYANRQSIARFLALSELFESQLEVKGSVVECGVFEGMGLFTFAQLSQIYEPANYHR